MATLSRLYDFAPNDIISDSEVDAEFNQIVEALNGTKVNTRYTFTYNASDAAGVIVNNTGGGVVQAWQVGTVEKAKVNASGQFESVLTTGTAPIKVVSTTLVANLNADLLDGLEAAAFVQAGTSPVFTADGVSVELADSGTDGDRFRWLNDGNALTLQVYDDDESAWEDLYAFTFDASSAPWTGANWPLTFNTEVFQTVTPPTDDTSLVRKDYVDDRRIPFSIGTFFEGPIASGQKAFIYTVPADALNFTVKALKLISEFTGGSGTTTVQLTKYSSDFVTPTVIDDVSITGAVTEFLVGSTDVDPDVTLAAGEHLVVEVTAAGTQENISFSVEGTHTVA